ncbi:MAG: hypothetical protein HY816_11025 [Candidatus Wallbacteria bacterium]|nr:hypothetical protein [Candidatus Wallbacteria bacterium]
MTRTRLLPTFTALALSLGVTFAAEPPSSGDIIFTPGSEPAHTQTAAPQDFTLEKIDYALASDRQAPAFDELHSRLMAALAEEVRAGNKSAGGYAAELATLKATADTAYESFMAALAELKKATGVDVVADGTAGVPEGIEGLAEADSVRARDLVAGASRHATHVLGARSAYRGRANAIAERVLAARQ